MATDQQRTWVINDLITDGLTNGHLEIAEVSDGYLKLRLTEAGHSRLDGFFEAKRWHVSLSLPGEDDAEMTS